MQALPRAAQGIFFLFSSCMKFGQAIENMNSGKKMHLPGRTGACTLERDEKGRPVRILSDAAQAKLTHADLLSEGWEVA